MAAKKQKTIKVLNEINVDDSDRLDIIEHYKQNPFLWDITSKQYHNTNVRTGSLMQLAEYLGQKKGIAMTGLEFHAKIIDLNFPILVDSVKSVWESLKRCYNREKKKPPTGSARDDVKPWRFFPYMLFLDANEEMIDSQ
jgi:hypothetical protein